MSFTFRAAMPKLTIPVETLWPIVNIYIPFASLFAELTHTK